MENWLMGAVPKRISVRLADLTGYDSVVVGRLVEAYLTRTEAEKATRLGDVGDGDDLPERYRHEVADPMRAYENATVYLSELDGVPVGVAVVQEGTTVCEIKRVWVDPRARGHRVGSALIDAALADRNVPVRLTVWEWRSDALQLYRKRGFVPVSSWDDRKGLICMERAASTSSGATSRRRPGLPRPPTHFGSSGSTV